MFSKKVGKRSLAVLMSILMLGNEVLPAVAAGEESMGDAVVCADEQENAVSENTPEDGSVEADPAEDLTAADEQEVSENDAVSDNNAVSENDTDDADVEEDENEAENAGDVSTEEEDAADGEIVWKEPAADWYKSFEYETKDGNIYLKKAKSSLEGNVLIPATATISGKEYKTVMQIGYSWESPFWDKESEKLTGVKFEKGVKVKDGFCSGLFEDMKNIKAIDVSGLDTSDVTDMWGMFRECRSLTYLNISGLDTSNAENLGSMFWGCENLTELDVSGFDTSNATDLAGMFLGCDQLKSIDVSGFDTSKCKDMLRMFAYCHCLEQLDVSGFDTGNVTNMWEMFIDCFSLKELDVSGFDTSNVKNMEEMFDSCGALDSLDVSSFDTSNVTTMRLMFSCVSAVKELDVSGFDTSKVTDMSGMFAGCSALESLDVSGFDTSNVTRFGGDGYLYEGMFAYCEKLKELDVSDFDTSQATNMDSMFKRCRSLESLDVSGFDTSKVTDMGSMFCECANLKELNVSGFKTSKVKDMASIFSGCSGITSLDVSHFNTSSATDMGGMFGGLSSVTALDLSSFKTKNVTDMGGMFSGCVNLSELDLSGFRTAKVKNMAYMFSGCTKLNKLDVSSFDTASVDNMVAMFADCTALTEIDIRSFIINDACVMKDVYNDQAWNTFLNSSQNVALPVRWAKGYDWSNSGVKKIKYAGTKTEWDALVNIVPSGVEIVYEYTEGIKEPVADEEQSPLDPQPVINESTKDIYLVKGQKFVLDAGWESSDKKVLSVSKKGVVKAKKVSDTVTLKKGEQTITVHISQPTWKKKSISEIRSDERVFHYLDDPFGFEYDDMHLGVLWYSNKPDIADFTDDGRLEVKGKGTAVITAYINGTAYKFKLTCKIKPYNKKDKVFTNTPMTLHLNLNDTKTVAAAGGKKAEWTAGDESIIEVLKNGKIKAKAIGRTELRGKTEGKWANIDVFVEDITIKTAGFSSKKKNDYTVDMSAGEIKKIEYAYVDQSVVYKSSAPDVAFIDENGNLIARKAGKAKLTTTINGKKIKITVNVKEKQ